MKIGNVGRYLDAVVEEFQEDVYMERFEDAFAIKRKLWKCAVIVWESDPMPGERIEQLRVIALDAGLRATDIGTTIASARRKADNHA